MHITAQGAEYYDSSIQIGFSVLLTKRTWHVACQVTSNVSLLLVQRAKLLGMATVLSPIQKIADEMALVVEAKDPFVISFGAGTGLCGTGSEFYGSQTGQAGTFQCLGPPGLDLEPYVLCQLHLPL